MSDPRGDAVARRDELLELLYWIEGEGIGGAATLEALTRFLAQEPNLVRDTLIDLMDRGEVIHERDRGEFRLSDPGRREGARRFRDEFAPLLGQGHGECHDPSCECHADPEHAVPCHGRR